MKVSVINVGTITHSTKNNTQNRQVASNLEKSLFTKNNSNVTFRSDKGALLGILGGAVAGAAAAAIVVATGGLAAAVAAVGSVGVAGAGAGFGAQVGGVVGGLISGDEDNKK